MQMQEPNSTKFENFKFESVSNHSNDSQLSSRSPMKQEDTQDDEYY